MSDGRRLAAQRPALSIASQPNTQVMSVGRGAKSKHLRQICVELSMRLGGAANRPMGIILMIDYLQAPET